MKTIYYTISASVLLLLSMESCEREKAYNVPHCSTIWNGNFYNIQKGNVDSDTEIIRKGDQQIEKSKDGSIHEFKVEWLDSCRYRLINLSGKKSSADSLKTVIVQIISVTKDSYSIEAWIEGDAIGTYHSELKIIR